MQTTYITNAAGPSGNNSTLTANNPNAPEGQQVAFVEKQGSFRQSVAGWAAGSYRINFRAAQRGAASGPPDVEDFQVLVDGQVVGTIQPNSTTYQSYSTPAFTVGAGSHVVAFRGLGTAGGSPMAFIDAVAIQSAPGSLSGTGLSGTYFADDNLSVPVLTRSDATVNFAWGTGSPAAGVPSDHFSARWTGQVMAPNSGTYTFTTAADDGVRLWVEGQLLIDTWGSTPGTTASGTITLNAGQLYAVRLEYHETTGTAAAQLKWSGPGITQQVVPQFYLYPSTTAPANARLSTATAYYDAANRLTATVNVGTVGGVLYNRPASVPARSDIALVTSYVYDPSGHIALMTDPRGISTAFEHDLQGRVTRSVAAFSPSSTWTPGTSTAALAASTASTNNTVVYTYDGLGRTRTVTAVMPTGTPSQTTTYVYGVSPAAGSAITSNDLLLAIVQPDEATGLLPTGSALASHSTTYTYNAWGDVTGATDANGTTHQYTYDVLGRRTADAVTTLGAGIDGAVCRLETAYDTQGNPYLFTSYDAAQGGTIVDQVLDTYNGLGQLTARYQEHSGAVNTATTPAVRYTYRAMAGGANDSRLLSMIYPNGRVIDYLYNAGLDDAIGRVSGVAEDNNGAPGQVLEAYAYLGLGTILATSRPQTGITLSMMRQPGDIAVNTDGGDQYTGLDRFGRVIDLNYVRTNGTTAARYQYGYDRAGNALYRADLVNTALSEMYHGNSATAGDDNSGYDALGRLTGFRRGILSASGRNGSSLDTVTTAQGSQSWDLDALGNWAGVTTNGTTTTKTFNAANQETSSSAGATPTFDNNGNTLTSQGKSYRYDAWNRLVAVRESATNALVASYRFDALRRRIVETHGSTVTHTYFTPSWQVIEERTGGTAASNATTQYVLGAMGIVLRDKISGGSFVMSDRLYALSNAKTDVVALTNASGAVVERYTYSPYGTVTVLDANGTPVAGNASVPGWQYLFQGGRLDGATGLYLFQHRDYDPTQGKWIERDPIGLSAGDANTYRFVENDPIDLIDPTGLDDEHGFVYWLLSWFNINFEANGSRIRQAADPAPNLPSAVLPQEVNVTHVGAGLAGGNLTYPEVNQGIRTTIELVSPETGIINPGIGAARGGGAIGGRGGRGGRGSGGGRAGGAVDPPVGGAGGASGGGAAGAGGRGGTAGGGRGGAGGRGSGGAAADPPGGSGSGGSHGGSSSKSGPKPISTTDPLSLVPERFRDTVRDAFEGPPTALTLQEDLTVYRRWGGTSPEVGSPWFSPIQYEKPGNAQRYLALPEGNTAENLTVFTIPQGTTILSGRVAPQPGFGPRAVGGGEQIYLPNPGLAIKR